MEETFADKAVIVDNHVPSSRSVHHWFARDLLTPELASNLEVEGWRMSGAMSPWIYT
ncbi:MAG: hypothetical protein KZQ96_08065 [Candidatus Thiodiazotropha sp. (ex Lucinoma borealis)]|nr:hypothetical protein [Candidatus Thiodiazotropha sp. (ex Lucinoma borealis)]MCU7856890.1 hypothetical protein [Candidatus Thiodiazotropha sp. (ex Lucinoma borealis)]MCU7869340.1 hypothetical protein [Candidatus Thiodiazotropha sp. (ex Lucinoma borealis)]